MESERLGIGELARASGLAVGTLRYYDGVGVLVPAWVDPHTGYRWYDPEQVDEARLLARLRLAGMPLADIRLALAGWSGTDPGLAPRLLGARLRRLERDMATARRQLSEVRTLISHRENPMTTPPENHATATLTLSATALAKALDTVRFAVGTDPELPSLHGVLLDGEGDELRLVATDRYRLAVATAAVTEGGGSRSVRALVPTPLVDAMRALLAEDARATLTLAQDDVSLNVGGRLASGATLEHEYPDYRRLIRLPAGRRCQVHAPSLSAAIASGRVREEPGDQDGARTAVTVLDIADDGVVRVADEATGGRIAVNREFLTEALAAAGREQLVLEVSGATAPLVVRLPSGDDHFSLLMPVRLSETV
ncbi:MerR family transcriptional regulator [Streptomyces profundus]|uniref:DNA polymerase III subunit beta family protein n=1 Tax=Streptomyces profundus TaxID=2867410 RepID=UPI001D16A1BE|nr:MerR family transcriptional regulator [Streptomyces sp. MA3_2.13]UED83544.1 MerR family transcriptional regulator [Streptomyces sp. MA3_2.13]